MQSDILAKNDAASLRVHAVWVPFSRAPKRDIAQSLLPDPRVSHYWDGSQVASTWFADNIENNFVPVFDGFYLYGPEAEWTQTPGPLVESGTTIIARRYKLRDALAPLLAASGAAP